VTDGPFAEAIEVLRLLDDPGEIQRRSDPVGHALPGSGNEIIEIRQIQEMSDFPAEVQKAAEGFTEMQTRNA